MSQNAPRLGDEWELVLEKRFFIDCIGKSCMGKTILVLTSVRVRGQKSGTLEGGSAPTGACVGVLKAEPLADRKQKLS